MRYPLPDFLPDQLPRGDIATVCKNLYPAKGGWRAAKDFQSISGALPAAFLGGVSFKASDGTTTMLAGTATTLSRLSGSSWVDLVDELTIPGRWRFAQFGDYALCVNGVESYQVDLVTITASAITDMPSATSITVVGDHVVIGQPDGNGLRVAWSAFNDHTGWTYGTDQSGEKTMLSGGEVMGVAGGEYGVILQRDQLTRMTRTGDADAPFAFDTITDNFGCAAKSSIVAVGRTVFFLSDRGFMAIEDGQAPRMIGHEKFDNTFRANLGEDGFERVFSAVDPKNTRVYWGIPGIPGTIWGYDWGLDRAFTLEIPFDGVFSGFLNSTDMDTLALTYSDLDAMTISLDDPRWTGGAPRFYVVQNGEVGVLTGFNLPALLTSGQFAPSGNQTTRLRAIWPETDATAGITVSVQQSQRRGDTGSTRTGSSLQASGRIPVQAKGKFYALSVAIDDPDWTYIDALTLEMSAGGLR